MNDRFLLGIDIGTTASKALLVDERGCVVASASHGHPLSTPRPLWSEQDPLDWWKATVAAIRGVKEKVPSGSSIVGVGLTGQMHGLVLLDHHGDVLRPCILWNDQRTVDQCAEITRRHGMERILQLTGNLVLPGFTAPKLLWVQQHEPAVYEKIDAVLLPKDYVRYRLTGLRATDVSDASGTAWFNVADRSWSEEMLGALDVKRSWLPEVGESTAIMGRISPSAAGETGLPVGALVVAGAGDQAAQAVGSGIVDEGIVSVTLGTSGVVFAASNRYRAEPEGKLHAFCHAVPGMWHVMGVMLSAGGSLRWFRDALGEVERMKGQAEGRDPYDVLMETAAVAPAGCEGLLFLPYLTGERTPYANPYARGVFFGLTLRHGKPHMIRAVLEGVAFGLRDSLELIRGLGINFRELRASGGGTRGKLWRQILADVLNQSIHRLSAEEGAAYGATLLAGVGVGVFPSVAEACKTALRIVERTDPGADAAIYSRAYPRYRALYPALAPHFRATAD